MRAIQKTQTMDDPEELCEFFEPPSLGAIFKPLQKRAELIELYRRVHALRPKTVLEIGTHSGGSLLLLCRAAAPAATVVSLDLPGGPFGGGYSPLRIPYFRAFAGDRQRVHLIRANSHTPDAFNRVQRALGGNSLDFLFIDGDHSYAGVRQDFQTYGPLVRPGGLIAFHDILPAPEEIGGGVSRFWAEIKGRYATEELVEDPFQGKMGVGLIRIPESGLAQVGERT
jgi:predicted O-methyltransferase YrrM